MTVPPETVMQCGAEWGNWYLSQFLDYARAFNNMAAGIQEGGNQTRNIMIQNDPTGRRETLSPLRLFNSPAIFVGPRCEVSRMIVAVRWRNVTNCIDGAWMLRFT
jgi:hypothetical protein